MDIAHRFTQRGITGCKTGLKRWKALLTLATMHNCRGLFVIEMTNNTCNETAVQYDKCIVIIPTKISVTVMCQYTCYSRGELAVSQGLDFSMVIPDLAPHQKVVI